MQGIAPSEKGSHPVNFSTHIAFAAAILVVPSALASQSIPRDDLRAWARTHAHPVQLTGSGVSAQDLAPLRAIAGNARILAFGEPMHIAHEVQAMRNRMIQYAVTELGMRAVALETGLAKSRRLYDHVLGRRTESDSVLASSFSYGFGDHPENLELVHWLRTYNASRDSSRAVRLYGIDLTGSFAPSEAPALLEVLDYLDKVDSDRARVVRADFSNVAGNLNARRYTQLERAEQDAIAGRIQNLRGLLRRQRPMYIAATSADDYDWAPSIGNHHGARCGSLPRNSAGPARAIGKGRAGRCRTQPAGSGSPSNAGGGYARQSLVDHRT